MTALGKSFVSRALTHGALELVPSFRKLKNGRLSPYFFNSGLYSDGRMLEDLGSGYATLAKEFFAKPFDANVLVGMAYKGISLAAITALRLWQMYKINVDFVYNRKEEKDHGEGGVMVGPSLKGKRALIVDDVITTGDTKSQALQLVEANGAVAVGCLIAFDLAEALSDNSSLSAAQEFSKQHNIPVRSIANLDDLIAVLKEEDADRARSMLPLIMGYQRRWCV